VIEYELNKEPGYKLPILKCLDEIHIPRVSLTAGKRLERFQEEKKKKKRKKNLRRFPHPEVLSLGSSEAKLSHARNEEKLVS
jgi:hypothetical protein